MDFQVTEYKHGDEKAILGLFQLVFQRDISLEYWRWRYADNPAGSGVIQLAWDGETLAGHYALARTKMSWQGEVVSSSLSMTTMTHPDYRRKGLFRLLAESCYLQAFQNGIELVYGFPNENSYYGFVNKLEWLDLGDEIEMVYRGENAPEPRGFSIKVLESIQEIPSDLFKLDIENDVLHLIRDKKYFDWRYFKNPIDTYEVCLIETVRKEKAMVVFKLYNEGEVKKLHLMDCNVLGECDFKNIIAGIWEYAKSKDRNVLSIWGANKSSKDLLLDCGFTNTGFKTHLGFRPFSERFKKQKLSREDFYLTMGDSDVF